MKRYGKFVDAVWIQHRMRLKNARIAQATARTQARLDAALVAQIAYLYPPGTDRAVILAEAKAALEKAGAR